MRPRFSARAVYGVLHVATALAIAAALPAPPLGVPTLVLPAVAAATVLAPIAYGPSLGLGLLAFLVHQDASISAAGRRLAPATAFVLVGLLPLYLSTGFRSLAARRPFGNGPRPFLPEDAVETLAIPLAVAGVALPLAALFRKSIEVWPFTSLPFPQTSLVFVFLWATVLAAFVVSGLASVLRFRRLSPLEARIHLLETARESTAAEEAAIWRRLLRSRRRRARSSP